MKLLDVSVENLELLQFVSLLLLLGHNVLQAVYFLLSKVQFWVVLMVQHALVFVTHHSDFLGQVIEHGVDIVKYTLDFLVAVCNESLMFELLCRLQVEFLIGDGMPQDGGEHPTRLLADGLQV